MTDMAALQALGAELIARDRWSRDRILAFQRARLAELVTHAVETSPYYREMIGPITGPVELEQLPTLPKPVLIDEFDRIVTDQRIRLDELEAHLASGDGADLYLDAYRAFSTSGTSGLRALIVYSQEEFAQWIATSLRLFARIGITPQTRLVAIGAPNPLHITRQLFAAFRSGRSGTPDLSVLTPVDEIIDALNAYQPEALLGYASIAALLAEEQLRGRLDIRPRIVGVSAEVLTDEARRAIEQAWNIEPTQVYASTEVLYLASSEPPHRDLHTYDDLVIVEVVDEGNRPVPAGRPGYKVLVTNLVNRTQPLIRYELSDSVTVPDGPDPVRLPYGRLARIDGRSDDILELPGRDGGTVTVHPYRLRAPFATLRDVRQYQIVHAGDRLEVKIVLQPDAPHETVARVHAETLAALDEAGALGPALDVVVVDSIGRERGHAAKLKLIKRV
jgi:putative adenylate-forming enzyme